MISQSTSLLSRNSHVRMGHMSDLILIQTTIFFLYLIEGSGSVAKSSTFEQGLTKKNIAATFSPLAMFWHREFSPTWPASTQIGTPTWPT